MKHIAIIGGGISGLSIASKYKNDGNVVKVFESSDRPVGVIGQKKDGFLLDYGPNTLNIRLKQTKRILKNMKLGIVHKKRTR